MLFCFAQALHKKELRLRVAASGWAASARETLDIQQRSRSRAKTVELVESSLAISYPDAASRLMHHPSFAALRAAVSPYEAASTASAAWQIATSLGLYLGVVAMMYWSLTFSYWFTLALCVPAALLLVRVFIIQHDCGHGSFLTSKRGNDVLGALCGILTLAPYANWKRQHAAHHANWNNLDRRESGTDLYSTCLTLDEYRAMSPTQRLLYRLPRHWLVAHILLPPLVFLLLYRVPFDTPKAWTRERRSVWLTNFAIGAAVIGLGLSFGFTAVIMVHLPIVMVTTIVGVWLFSVQHRFETAHWFRKADWTFTGASFYGTSFLDVSPTLHWATGNIGYHHIHHLAPRVPSYRLAHCHRSSSLLQPERPLSMTQALKATNLALWDERQQKLIRFADATATMQDRCQFQR